jgi:hypothetical protein
MPPAVPTFWKAMDHQEQGFSRLTLQGHPMQPEGIAAAIAIGTAEILDASIETATAAVAAEKGAPDAA